MCCLITCTCLHKNILCGNYGSGANHHAWGFIVLQFPFISQSSPRATFWLMSTPIQHKINSFHSRRLEMVGNIIPPYSWQQCMCYSKLAENMQKEEENRFFFTSTKLKLYQLTGQTLTSKTTLMCLSDSALPGLERQVWRDCPGEGLGSSLSNKYAFTAGKSKQTQNLKGSVTKKWGWFQVELKLLLPSFLTLFHLPLLRAPISHCVQLSFKHSWWHNDWDKDISSSCQWHSNPETVPGTSSKSPPSLSLVSMNKREGFTHWWSS